MRAIWAVVPVKDTRSAKQRLATALPQAKRSALALAMLEDVLDALARAGIDGVPAPHLSGLPLPDPGGRQGQAVLSGPLHPMRLGEIGETGATGPPPHRPPPADPRAPQTGEVNREMKRAGQAVTWSTPVLSP